KGEPSMDSPRILAVGTAVPPTSFTQDELIDIFGYTDPRYQNLFRQSGIERRHFFVEGDRTRPDEDVDQLAARFEAGTAGPGGAASPWGCRPSTPVSPAGASILPRSTFWLRRPAPAAWCRASMRASYARAASGTTSSACTWVIPAVPAPSSPSSRPPTISTRF